MPVIIATFLMVARLVDDCWDKKFLDLVKIKNVFFSLAVIALLSDFFSFPGYLSYYNVLGGGTREGYKVATDSNHDWGQDVKRLANWVNKNNIDKIYVNLFTRVPLQYYLGNRYLPLIMAEGYSPSSGSYVALSTMRYQNNVFDKNVEYAKSYKNFGQPITLVGSSILVFRVP